MHNYLPQTPYSRCFFMSKIKHVTTSYDVIKTVEIMLESKRELAINIMGLLSGIGIGVLATACFFGYYFNL